MDKKKVTIVTHDGKFHPDDVFAVATLLVLLKDKMDIAIVRSRDKAVIDVGDYVVDVGGVYDPNKNRFDHHQFGGAGVRENTIPYASFGLVWKKYGAEVSGSIEIAEKIEKLLVEPVDADDNGILLSDSKITNVIDYSVCSFIYAFDPSWKEGLTNVDIVFLEVVSYIEALLKKEIRRCGDKIIAKDIVQQIYTDSIDKRLIIMDKFYPSDEFLSSFSEPLFVVFPKEDKAWILHSISSNPGSFENRKKLPESWAGKRDEELEQVTGVLGATFCHNARFIAIAKTKEAILKMAEIALNS